MYKVINIIAQDHEKWIRIAKSFGAYNNAEDIVQDMYLKINSWKGKYDKTLMFNDTEVNYFFIFKVLRNIYLDEVKKKKHIVYTDTIYNEPIDYVNSFEYTEALNEINEEIKNWHLYEIKIYELIFFDGWNMTTLSNKSGINYYSIRRTVEKIKRMLNKKIQ